MQQLACICAILFVGNFVKRAVVTPQQPEVWNVHRSRNKRSETHGVAYILISSVCCTCQAHAFIQTNELHVSVPCLVSLRDWWLILSVGATVVLRQNSGCFQYVLALASNTPDAVFRKFFFVRVCWCAVGPTSIRFRGGSGRPE